MLRNLQRNIPQDDGNRNSGFGFSCKISGVNEQAHVNTKKAVLFEVGVDSLSRDEILKQISLAASGTGHLLIAHVNIRGLNLTFKQPWLREFYQRADLVYCDGMGVMLGAHLLGEKIQERFTLADWIWDLSALAANNGFSLFLLGGAPGVSQKAAAALQRRFPSLQIAGVQHGFFEKSPAQPENQALVARLNVLQPDILLVGFGMPAQERWLDQNWSSLNVRVAITCGALFEYLSGDLRRGPRWMTDHYLEWLARLVISPRRYTGRYLSDIPIFLYHLAQQRIHAK